MILLDTNVIVYMADHLLDESDIAILQESTLDTCNIVIAEVLGFMRINPNDEGYFRDLLKKMNNHLLDDNVTNKTIELRKTTTLKLPDAIIAATALVNNLELWTHNTQDFKSIQGLKIYDPITR